MPRPGKRIRNDFTLGEEAAEHDALLEEAFYETALYRLTASRDNKRCFLVGRTGSGKSACFHQLERANPRHYIDLSPEDLSLPYIAGTNVIRALKELDIHLDPLFIALWKHVIIIEVIKHRYNVDSPEATGRFYAGLMEKLKRNKSKQEALKYLEEFEGKFWSPTSDRIKEIVRQFENQIETAAGGKVSMGLAKFSATGGGSRGTSVTERAELVDRYQRLVYDTQLARLNRMVRVLDEDILESPQHFTYITIDDLDREWADEKVTNDLIRCLFRAVLDMKRVQNLKILVALRTNIFEALDFGRAGGQEEKFRGLIHEVRWTSNELKELLESRFVVAARRYGMEGLACLAELLPRATGARGDPLDYILSRTLLRPRDAIAFLNVCFSMANGKDRLTWEGIKKAEATYSQNRLLALRDEWKPTFPGIDRVLRMFSRSPVVMDWAEMTRRLDDCALLLADAEFPGVRWMTELSEPIWTGLHDDPCEDYQPLIRLLHNIGFIGCIMSTQDRSLYKHPVDDPAIFGHNEPTFPDYIDNLRQTSGFTVHPAFRNALDIRG